MAVHTHVLAWMPARLDAVNGRGWWDLLAVDDYRAGNPPDDGHTFDLPRDTHDLILMSWVEERLGQPVTLSHDVVEVRTGRFSRPTREPLLLVHPAGTSA